MTVQPIPEGYSSITPYLVASGADRLIDFLKRAFGAEERLRMPRPDGGVAHAEVRIGDSIVMVAEACEQAGPTSAMLYLYVEDVDATYQRAVQAGGVPLKEPADQFYGDRSGGVKDPAGNQWWIATHIEDVPPDELEKRAEAAMSQHTKG